MAIKRITLMTAVGILCATSALSDERVQRGKELADKHCAQCHDISPDGAFKTYPPSFASIAVFRSENQIRGRIMFQSVHTAMPRFGYILMPDDFEPLVAYILSLETKPD